MSRTKKLPSKIATGNIAIESDEDTIHALFKSNPFPYQQDTKQEYLAYLNRLELADLQCHAVEHGVIPSAVSRSILTDRLEKEFLNAQKKFAYIGAKNTQLNSFQV